MPNDSSATALNDKQVHQLRSLYRQDSPILAESLDGRVMRACAPAAALLKNVSGCGSTDAGRAEFERLRRRRIAAGASHAGTRKARADAILRAAQALELALPRDAEVMVGDMAANGATILEALFSYGRRLARYEPNSRGSG